MHVRNVWFDLPSLLVAVLMGSYAIFAIMHQVRQGHAIDVATAVAAGVFLLLALPFFYVSLHVGSMRRKARQSKKDR